METKAGYNKDSLFVLTLLTGFKNNYSLENDYKDIEFIIKW